MKTKLKITKLQLTYRCLLAASLLSACSLSSDLNPSSLPHLTTLVNQYAPGTQQIQTIDMGQGKHDGGALLLKLRMKWPDGFKTHDSESGKTAKIDSDILKFRVFLYQFSGPGPVTPGILSSGNISGLSTLNENLTFLSPGIHEQNFLIKNVPAGNYYVGIAAFNHATLFDISSNIGDSASNYSYAEGSCFLTNSGGEGGSNPGRVTIGVSPNYPVTGSAQLTVNLNLQDNIGAKLDTRVNLVGGKVFFTANDGDNDIYSVEVDGLPENNLTSAFNSSEIDAQIRPSVFDRLLYMSNTNTDFAIFSMFLNGGTPTQLTSPGAGDNDIQPDWRPDGNDFVFTRRLAADSNRGDLYKYPFPTGGESAIFSAPSSDEHSPDWSANNTTIAYISNGGLSGNDEVWKIDHDGSNQVQLRNISPSGQDKEPYFSPSGSQILFVTSKPPSPATGADFEIAVMDENGSNAVSLTDNSVVDEGAVWSPDGSQIAWVQTGNIWVMDNDGNNQTQLTISGDNASPAWTSDGLQIIYKNGPSTNNSVYMMLKDGKARRRISTAFAVPTVQEISFLGP